MSDLHLGPTTPVELVDNAFAELSKLPLDVLVLGGDYVFLDATAEHARLLQSLLARVPAPHKVAVLGNHDLWTHHSIIEEALLLAGVHLLVNDSLRLAAPHQGVTLVGLDEPWTGAPDAAQALAKTSESDFRIAVCHSPDGAYELLGRADLFLAGHTHGGHIALPGGYPLVLPPGNGCRRWPHGRFHHRGTEIIVSRGIGGAELPIRMFAPPEVVVITLEPLR